MPHARRVVSVLQPRNVQIYAQQITFSRVRLKIKNELTHYET